MLLNIKFNKSPQRLRLIGWLGVLAAGLGAARLASAGPEDPLQSGGAASGGGPGRAGSRSGDAAPANPMRERYRDGSLWVTVERTQSSAGATQPVVLHAGSRTFHAGIDGHAIVELAPGVALEDALRGERLRWVETLSAAAGLHLVASAGGEDGAALASRLARSELVREAIPDLHLARRRQSISVPPNDPRFGGQWFLRKIGIEAAWRISTGNRDTTIVVIDDGCDMQHPDLSANLLGGLDLVDGDDDPSFAPRARGNAHGTQCAGLIAAQADNGIGIAGTCPECTLRCVRLLNNEMESVPLSADLKAFEYVISSGASVASNSWGFAEAMPAPTPLRTMILRVQEQGRGGKGALVLFAAGNENRELESNELQAIPGVITIGAVNNFDESSPFSNHGPSLYLTAPAGTITTDVSGPDGDTPDDYTDRFGGTSSACPVAAGVVGLLLSAQPELTGAEVREVLRATAREAPYADPDADGHDPTYGYGIVDPAAALRRVLGLPEPEPDAGVRADAGTPDAGGSVPLTKRSSDDGGCSVHAVAAGSAHLETGLILALLSAWRLRRARKRVH